MLRRFYKLIFILLIVALALYVVMLNQTSTTIYLGPNTPVEGNTGVILIAVFSIGLVFMALIAAWFGLKAYLRERNLHYKERQRQIFYDGLLSARSYLASGEWLKARDQWEHIVKKDPTDIIARVELSKSLQGSGDLREALKTLEQARSKDPNNVEVLFRAAELNLALGNRTAALDNLALIVYSHPNKRALVMARNLSEELERSDDALEYQRKLEELGEDADSASVVARLKFKQLIRQYRDSKPEERQIMKDEYKAFIKRNPACGFALQHLADLESADGNAEDAAQLYMKAARSGTNGAAQKAFRIWLKNNTPERALSAARSLSNESRGVARLGAEIEQVRLYIALNMLEDAKRALENFPGLAKREQAEISDEIDRVVLALKGLCLNRMGEFQNAADVWKELSTRGTAHDDSSPNGSGAGGEPSLNLPGIVYVTQN